MKPGQLNDLAHLPRRLLRSRRRGTVRAAAAVRCSAWFGACGEGHKAGAKGGLPLANVRDDSVDVKVELLGKFPASAMNLSDDWVFPHRPILP
jgi:hypothetical protein